MKRYLMILISSFLAGCSIVFGATFYLYCASQGNFILKLIGSFMFGIGLFTIINFGMWLYTGKVGYVLDNKPKYLIDLCLCLLGNLAGVVLLSAILKSTGVATENICELCKTLVNNKNQENAFELLVRSFMCGVMIYLAVEGHKRCAYPFGKVIFAFMPISLFIICGFEHVVANACYYTYAGSFSGMTILWFILMAIGDGVGSIAFDGLLKLIEKLNKQVEEKKSE